MNDPEDRNEDLQLVEQVDELNEEVKALALNLAIYLAKAKSDSEELNRLEPDFIRLVNGTVKAVQELTTLINAARNQETMVYEVPSGRIKRDQMEAKLQAILEQCTRIMSSLSISDTRSHLA